ncbi:hypothetical protein BV20DRAFT_86374 [Pilatotrama ljubarskyi]|nr:hypothetical protein BV20DRAFT_86374 [Pilatotrama ljubarskyi]
MGNRRSEVEITVRVPHWEWVKSVEEKAWCGDHALLESMGHHRQFPIDERCSKRRLVRERLGTAHVGQR